MRHAKPQPIRNKIDLADPRQSRILRRFGISADDLQRVVEKVGNSIAAGCEDRTDAGRNRIPIAIGSWGGRIGGLVLRYSCASLVGEHEARVICARRSLSERR
jgi:hypothetical protein